MSKLAIIGGVAAGMAAAAKARRVDPGLDITVFAEGEYISYGACGLPYFIGRRIKTKEDLIARTVEQFTAQSISVHTRHKVTAINAGQSVIEVDDLAAGKSFAESYDRLIIAAGARAFVPPLDKVDLPGIFTLRTIPDSLAIIDYLNKNQPQNAVIVGAGYIGLEMIENLMVYGCNITVVEGSPQILGNMDADMADYVQQYLDSHGIRVLTGVSVTGFDGDERVRKVITSVEEIPADIVILSIGVVPNSEVAAAAGIELGVKKAVKVNEKCETSVPNIWAAGDCATIRHILTGQDSYLALGTNANKQGKVAGENAAGGNSSVKGVLGTGIARIIDLEVSRTGISERECQQAGINYISHSIKGKTAAPYCPVSGEIRMKMLVSHGDQRILGAQIAGFAGSGKRIDSLATAITMGASIDDLINMDLAYSPPFSPVRDPILLILDKFRGEY